MFDARRLALVRTVHTAIYLVMATATFVVLYGGLTGAHGAWLWVATVLVVLESMVFVSAGMRCPLTALAVRYGSRARGLADTWLPERLTRHTLRFFGPVLVLGLTLLVARWARFGWPG